MLGVVGPVCPERKGRSAVGETLNIAESTGKGAEEGESPVREIDEAALSGNLSRAGHEKSCLNLGGPSPKAKYDRATDSG